MSRAAGCGLVVACLAATGAMILFGYLTGAWNREILATPIPYAMLLLCFFVVTPAYVLLHR